MPRFHFNTQGQRDEDGQILPSLEVAKCEAIKLAGRIICENAERFWAEEEWVMTVTDETGLSLFQLQIIATEAPVIRALDSQPDSARPL